MKPHLVVAGNGMAGMRVVETLCRLVPDQFHITVIGREPRENYNRIQLSPVLGGEKTFDQTVLHPRAWYRDHHVCLLTEETVTAIDPAQRTLTTSARELHWQQLILATGSRPVMPPIPGIDLPHVCGFRTLDDVQHMLAVDGPVVVVGGGLLGIEVAAALRRRGRKVTLVHLMDRLMERQLDAVAAEALLASLTERGIHCRLSTTLARIDVDGVVTNQGERLAATRVVIAIGVAPEAGLACGRGIITDGQLQTSVPAISAVGECCEIDGKTFGLLAPCLAQAEVLAHRLAGSPVADFQLTDAGTRLKVTGIEVFSAGDIDALPGDALYSAHDPETGHYRRLLVRDERLAGVLLYGDTGHAGGYLQRMQDATPVASGALFSPDNPQTPHAAAGRQTMSKPTLVVIGHGMVGHYFLEQLAQQGLDSHYRIVVFGDEPVEAYDRVHLTDYFAGSDAQALSLVKPGFMAEHDIDLRTGSRIVAIYRQRRCVCDDAGHETAYDRLVIATGSQAFVPPIPGHDGEGCFVYRTLADLDAIAARAKSARRGVVIGGGLLGLEAANALRKLGLETHVVEFAPRLMAVQLDDGGARLLRHKIEQLGVKVHTAAATREIAARHDGGLRLSFADGATLDTDLVVFSAGIRPRDQLARDCGLALGERGGIVIDEAIPLSLLSANAPRGAGSCLAWSPPVITWRGWRRRV